MIAPVIVNTESGDLEILLRVAFLDGQTANVFVYNYQYFVFDTRLSAVLLQ